MWKKNLADKNSINCGETSFIFCVVGLNSKIKIQVLVFFALFLLAEIALRLVGFKPGTLLDDFKIEPTPLYEQRFYSDEMGVNHIFPMAQNLMKGSVINGQGFRSAFPFTPEAMDSLRKVTRKEIIMVVGDSFVEGCCPDNVSESFPDILNRDSNYCVLNFGVAGTDPVQYELVIKKYLKVLRPDRIVVVVYFGNDILTYDRPVSPGVPLTYPFKDNKWIYSVAPNHLSGIENYIFKTPQEAYNFFVDHYTLKGKKRNAFEKVISHSVLFSKLYLYSEHTLAKRRYEKNYSGSYIDVNTITTNVLGKIVKECNRTNVPYVFVGIPEPMRAINTKAFQDAYKHILGPFKIRVPDNLTLEDYDGTTISNHFNKTGHLKYARFLKQVLDEEPKQGLN